MPKLSSQKKPDLVKEPLQEQASNQPDSEYFEGKSDLSGGVYKKVWSDATSLDTTKVTVVDPQAAKPNPIDEQTEEMKKLQREAQVKENERAKNVVVTQEQMKDRRFMDIRRWFCLARPQYKASCGISSLVSCWNYLFSTLGVGSKQPITTEEALATLGIEAPYQDINFGSFTGNGTLRDWFVKLN